MKKKIILSSVDRVPVVIDGYEFEVRGLTREEAIQIERSRLEIDQLNDEEARVEALLEIQEMLIDTCIEDEKARELVKNGSLKVINKITDLIMELSGLTEDIQKK